MGFALKARNFVQKNKMNTEIYYFSGSGNSLHVAKELQKRLSSVKLIPVACLLDEKIIKTHAEIVGFVFPIHGVTIPVPVKNIIKKLDLSSSKYLFALATRGGTIHNAFEVIDKILGRKCRRLDSYFSITMFSSDPKLKDWEPPTTKEIEEIEIKVQNQLNSIQKNILTKQISREKDSEGISFSNSALINFLLEKLILFAMKYLVEFKGLNNYFYTDEKCIGCGTCEKVCPSKKVKMINKKPAWQNNVKCHFCYACLHYCPKQAIQIKTTWYMKSYTQKKGRYPHPYATVDEIANQKCSDGDY